MNKDNFKYKIIIDTRQTENKHIKDVFDKNSIETDSRALPMGDYAIESEGKYVPNITIKRKGSIDALIDNLLDEVKDNEGHNVFLRELIRAKQCNKKFILLIEDKDYYKKLLTGDYSSNMNPKTIRDMIIGLEAKYPNLSIAGIERDVVASYIHSLLYCCLKEDLKQ